MRESFERIYHERHWVITDTPQPVSGTGSAGLAADRYVELVDRLLRDRGISDIVDIGCGDMTVASRFDLGACRYVGVDVVAHLIDEHRQRHGEAQRRFECLDVTVDPLPSGDCYLLRQVLQHLSNDEVTAALRQLPAGACVVVTESSPLGGPQRPNLDMPHGPHTRLPLGSAVQLGLAPFHVHGGDEALRVTTDHEEIVTTVYWSWPGIGAPS
jgi:SAM-dependent methyltransferase